MKCSSVRLVRHILALIREVLWFFHFVKAEASVILMLSLPAETLLLCLSGSTMGRTPAAHSAHLAISVAPLASQPPQDPAHLGTSASLALPPHHRRVSSAG